MSGALQAIFQNQRSFIPPVPVVGSALGGGYFAGQISTAANGTADYNLVVGPVASAQTTGVKFKTSNTNDAGAVSVIDGPSNSASMNDASHPAAQFCEGLTIGGFSDWYLPSQKELEICYYNLKPTTYANNFSAGGNIYAVPSRSGLYVSGNPAQTTATNFQSTGAECFNENFYYWTSTQESATAAWTQYFKTGDQYNLTKTTVSSNTNFARAVRRVAV